MTRSRLEAFSDAVIAILMTIMVLDLRIPQGADLNALRPVVPVFFAYLLSFIFLAIYWNNHHHMLHLTTHINGRILWANTHLLFWLSLFPFTTAWAGENHFPPVPTAIYGVVGLGSAIAWTILQYSIIAQQGPGSKVKAAVGKDYKGKISALAYLAAIPLAFVSPWISAGLYIVVAMMWLVPDKRFENQIAKNPQI
jgi:uncharacterized membrane protein